ncbi:ATP-binding cassette domain-containing protein, partial [Vibrio parahaemolyticus]|nr:ATP-binding cassette domain-containing protein [Vibrio parahaemolyticus]
MLDVSTLTLIRFERVLFENLQFEIKPGDLVQIEGRNGTGKTTLLRIITGLGDREEGMNKWKGEEVEKSRD